MRVERLGFKVGKKLSPGDESEAKAYAIMSNAKGMVLRATLCREAAELMQDESRNIHELWLLPPKDKEGRD